MSFNFSQTAGTSGETSIVISATSTTDIEDRIENYTIANNSGNSVVMSVMQKAYVPTEKYINLYPSSITWDGSGGTASLQIQSNDDWVITSNSWIELSRFGEADRGLPHNTISGNGNTIIGIRALENTGTTRTGGITGRCSSDSSISATTTVVQSAYTKPYIQLSYYSINCDSTGTTSSFTITSNVDWYIVVDERWTSVNTESGSGNANITFTVDENTSSFARSCDIAVYARDYGIKVSLTINQDATQLKPYITLSPDRFVVSDKGSTGNTIHVSANCSYDITTEANWITLHSSSGSGDGTVTFDTDPAPLVKFNTGLIEFSNSALSRTVTVERQGEEPYLYCDKSSITVGLDGGVTQFYVYSNVDWAVRVVVGEGKEWFSVEPDYGKLNDKVIVKVEISEVPRTGNIAIMNLEYGLSWYIKVNQKENNKIFYTTNDGNVTSYSTGQYFGDALITNNTYRDGQGVMVFDRDVTFLPQDAFRAQSYSNKLTSIDLPDTIETFGDYSVNHTLGVFEGQDLLVKDINDFFTDSVKYIGYGVFKGCSGLYGDLVLPDSVRFISTNSLLAPEVFRGTSITSVKLQDNIESVPNNIFRDCTSLSSVTIGHSATTIGGSAFRGCTSLEEIVIPNNVTGISSYSFANCTSLKSVVFSSGLMVIFQYGFSGCTSIVELDLPASYPDDMVPDNVFKDCTNLRKITYRKTDFISSDRLGEFIGCTSINEMYFYSQYPPSLANQSGQYFSFPDIPSYGVVHHKPVIEGQTNTYQSWKIRYSQFANWDFIDDL